MATIKHAFGGQEGLYQRILSALDKTPQHRPLFEDIASYHLRTLQSQPSSSKTLVTSDIIDEPALKKRKLPNGSLPIHAISGQRKMILEAPEISFSMPQRKKLVCGIYHYPATDTYTLAGKGSSSTEMEFEVPVNKIGVAMKLPVPEKAQRQWNYVFLPKVGVEGESVVFMVTEPAKGKEQEYVTGMDTPRSILEHDRSDKKKPLLEAALEVAGLRIVVPDEKEFGSATLEAHRKTEKAYHVKAFRGSKDSFLFFLATGIFFGFKKPLFFVGLEDIESVSYTSVLQRTFNVVISFKEEGDEETNEVEFSMLDQADFAGINGYVQRHELSDASLAEGRRAKMLGKKVKSEAKGDANGGEEDDDGRTELEKVEAQLQDEEDEMEEDFELDSDDEDEDASEESDDEDYDEEGGDIVKEELGSEAEDVSEEEGEEDDAGVGQEEEEEEAEDEVVEEVPQPLPAKAPEVRVRRPGEPDPEDDDQL